MFMGACTIAPNFCIVTEWCEGSTLYNLLHIKDVKLGIEEILETANEAARGMGYVERGRRGSGARMGQPAHVTHSVLRHNDSA